MSAKPVNLWWGEGVGGAEEVASNAHEHYRRIRSRMISRRNEDRHHLMLYANGDPAGEGQSIEARLDVGFSSRLRYNLCSSIVDTAASVIAQQRPKPQYITYDGDWGLQRQARLRTRVLEGQLYETGAYDLAPEAFLDGAITGTGALYPFLCPESGKVKVERSLPMEWWVDPSESVYGQARTYYRTRLVPREVMQRLYGSEYVKHARGISGDERRDFWLTFDEHADQILVVEAWHRPSGPVTGKDGKARKHDGKHVIFTSVGAVHLEAYEHDEEPAVFYRYTKRPFGFWGMGLVERVRDPQWRIQQLVQRINALTDLGSNMHVFVQGQSSLLVEQLDNSPCKIYRTNGPKPDFVTVNAVPQELFLQIEDIKEKAFAQEGFSQMTAESQKPAGLDSGAALRTHEDISSRRHIMMLRGWESFYMRLVRKFELLNGEAAKKSSEYQVTARMDRGRVPMIKQVKWGAVDLAENKYRLDVLPTSALPTTPGARIQTAQEWVDRGWISRPYAMQLVDFPDLDAATRNELADLDLAMFHVEEILDGNASSPTAYQDLDLAADVARRSRLRAELSGAPDSVLDALGEYAQSAIELRRRGEGFVQQSAPQQPAQPTQPAQGAPSPELAGAAWP